MAFPLAAGAAASAFGSQPFGKAMDGFNKANGPQPLNYEDWKANTGQAGAKGYQDYSQGFAATPAPPPPVVPPPAAPPPPVAPPLDMSGFVGTPGGQQRWMNQSGGTQDQFGQAVQAWQNNASAPPPVPPSPVAPPLDMSGFRGTGGQQRWMAQSGGTRDQYYQAVEAWRRSRGVPQDQQSYGNINDNELLRRLWESRAGGATNVRP